MVATTVSRRLVARPREGLAQRDRGSLRFPSSAALYICVGRFGPHAAACIEAHLACIPNPRAAEHPCWSIRFRCLLFALPLPAGRLPTATPTRQGRAFRQSTIHPRHAPVSFAVYCLAGVVYDGAWAIRASEQWLRASVSCRGGARGPACRAPGSIGGVLGRVAIASLS